jgi:hypothetical protein
VNRWFGACIFALGATILAASLLLPAAAAQTPRLKIKTKHHDPQEEQKKQQIERLAQQYDLKKYTLTRDILIERGVISHSHPVLTLNLRFMDNDDLALSAYVHEQGHWVLTDRGPQLNSGLFDDLTRNFRILDYSVPNGDGEMKSSYFHIAVCMLEWQAMEALRGPERARWVIQWKKDDHYKAIYAIVLNQRSQVESILNRHSVHW